MAAIIGFGEFSISPMISGRLGGCDGLLNSVMSAPAMKVRPAPTSTIARVAASSRACVSVLNRPARTTCLSALTGGLSTVMAAISPSFCKPTSVVTGSHPPRWCDSDRRSAESIFARGAGAFHSGTNSAVRKLILQFDGDARNWCICCQRKASKRKRSCGARSIKPARWTGVACGTPRWKRANRRPTALEQTPNRYRTKSICKEIALQRPKSGKFDYLSGPNHPAHSIALEFFTDDEIGEEASELCCSIYKVVYSEPT